MIYPILDSVQYVTTLEDERGRFDASYDARQGADRWAFSETVHLRANGELWWFTTRPLGVLIKYPCGTKRFINGLTNLPA